MQSLVDEGLFEPQEGRNLVSGSCSEGEVLSSVKRDSFIFNHHPEGCCEAPALVQVQDIVNVAAILYTNSGHEGRSCRPPFKLHNKYSRAGDMFLCVTLSPRFFSLLSR